MSNTEMERLLDRPMAITRREYNADMLTASKMGNAAAVAEARAPLVEALEKVEWPEIYHRTAMIGRLCPGCGQWKGDDPDWDYHATLCPLAAALAAKETP